jgi:hypothetical protein
VENGVGWIEDVMEDGVMLDEMHDKSLATPDLKQTGR